MPGLACRANNFVRGVYLPRDLKHLSCFPLFDVDHLEIVNCSNLTTTVFYPLDNFGQALCIRSCHEDLILTRKSHNWAGIAFIQEDSAVGSKLIEQTLDIRSARDWVLILGST